MNEVTKRFPASMGNQNHKLNRLAKQLQGSQPINIIETYTAVVNDITYTADLFNENPIEFNLSAVGNGIETSGSFIVIFNRESAPKLFPTSENNTTSLSITRNFFVAPNGGYSIIYQTRRQNSDDPSIMLNGFPTFTPWFINDSVSFKIGG